jgi:hypothetical protein
LKIIILHCEIFEFPQFFFCLQILFNVNGKATVGDTTLVTYLPTNGQHLLLTEWLTKVKLDSNSLEVHPQLSHSRHPVDGALVDTDLL